MSVVVPAIAAGSSLACIRSLGRKGIPVIAASESPESPAFASKYVDERASLPAPIDGIEGYRDGLLSLAERPDVETIVPLREPESYVLSKYRERFAEHVGTPWPDFETMESARDRNQLFQRAEEVGIPIPETKLLTEWDDWRDDTVVKSRYTVLVRDNRTQYPGVRFVSGDPDELDTPDEDRLIAEMGHVPIVQECIPDGTEYGFFALFDHGEPVVTFQHQRIRSYTYSGGASVFRRAVSIPTLHEQGVRLLSALDWHGPAMVEFRHDPRDGGFKLLEVNPRFWGSLQLGVHAGVDFPYRYYQLANGVRKPDYGYTVGTGSHILRGELVYLVSLLRDDYDHVERPSVPSAVARVLFSLATDPNFDYFSWDDPGPFRRDLTNLVGEYAPSKSAPLKRAVSALVGK
ncbi:carboxylate--amine ligase [Haladaptatus sp. R4]|uniref:carboxylate--amine ligase n=1 Tax=Haladaptatus sp. R4 TaxID=1679489 RepID=UPI0007B49090|nr:ATP-grasp domain-containing protein [Haladaptatus sp. R4]KZN25654.1 carboxylate--amine ligase [Haladaptatus sp. R4]